MITELSPEHLRLDEDAARRGVLVAFSGGVDSTVLFHLMRRWARPRGIELAAAHVDHRLRASSGGDAAFCQRIARGWGVPLVVETLDVEPHGSIQENARVQRYAALARAARRLELGMVVTAHQADDALETALLNFRRGSSSGGLASGLRQAHAPILSWPDLALARPLSRCWRDQIEEYARARGLSWRTDPTNAKDLYQRNRLRQKVLPALTDDGRLRQPMLDTLENLAGERRALQILADRCLEAGWLEAPDPDTVVFRTAPLEAMPHAVVALALKRAAGRLDAGAQLGHDHLHDASRAITQARRARLAVRGAVLHIERGLAIVEAAYDRGGQHLGERTATSMALDFTGPGAEIAWFGSRLQWRVADVGAGTTASPRSILVDPGEAPGGWVLRGPRPGDRLRLPSGDHKSVADILREAGVPTAFRWKWPCVAARGAGDLAWICGLRHADGLVGPASSVPPTRLEWRAAPNSIFDALAGASPNPAGVQYS